jgi:PhnB protein
MASPNQTIIPMLAYENGIEALEWLCRAFQFKEKTRWLDEKGKLTHGEIVMGENMVMLASPTDHYQSPRHHREVCKLAARWHEVPYVIDGVLVMVDNVEDHFRHAKANGAIILSPIETGGPGTRYRAEDIEGHRWMFIQKEV